MTDFGPFLEASVRTATPLLLASAGESVSERAGVINVGLEGCIIAGAYAAYAAGSTSTVSGYAAAIGAGLFVGLLMALLSVFRRQDQVVVGTALTMFALGATGALYRARDAGAPIFAASEPVLRVPLFSKLPVIGGALFAQPATTYLVLLLLPLLWWTLRRTQLGLALRAVGDSHEAAIAAGIRVPLVQSGAVLFASALGGLAGGALVLAQAGSFAEGMSAGRGFLAIAIVALGRWRVAGAAVASLVFGAALALQYVVQALGWRVRYELVLMIPYVATLAALGFFGRATSPATLGRARPES